MLKIFYDLAILSFTLCRSVPSIRMNATTFAILRPKKVSNLPKDGIKNSIKDRVSGEVIERNGKKSITNKYSSTSKQGHTRVVPRANSI